MDITPATLALAIVLLVVSAVLIFFVFFSGYLRGRSMQRLYRPRTIPVSNTATPISSPSDPIRGLDQAVINSFPTFDYSAVESFITRRSGTLECYVCLNEFEPHETLRLLPSCDHAFHIGCINAWLASNATCPVCRAKLHDLTHHITTDEAGPRDLNDDDAVMINVAAAADDIDHDHDDDDTNVVDPHPPARPRPKLLGLNRPWRSMRSGKPIWSAAAGMMRLTRSKSTGRVAVKQWETMERFTLRLPEEVRRKIVAGKLRRPKASHDDRVIIPGRGGSHREESTWGKWVSSLAPGFLYTRSKSMEPPAITPAFDHV